MKAEGTILGIVIFVCLTTVSFAVEKGEGESESESASDWFAHIKKMQKMAESRPLPVLGDFRSDAVEARDDVEEILVKWAFSENSESEVRLTSIYVLGEYRMKGAVKALIKHIDYKAESILTHRLPPWGQYPAVEALVKIGKPAVSEALKLIEEKEVQHIRELATRVVREVEGLEVGRFIIKQRIKKEENPEKRKRLQQALASKYFSEESEEDK